MKPFRFCRWVNHTLVWRPNYLNAFNAHCLSAIEHAVQRSEHSNRVELCVIAEHTLPFSYIRRGAPLAERAIMLFGKHRVWDTEQNTGVLIYINYAERRVELVADRLPYRLIAQSQWSAWAAQLEPYFASKQFEQGLTALIADMQTVFDQVLPKDQSTQAHSANDVRNAPVLI